MAAIAEGTAVVQVRFYIVVSPREAGGFLVHIAGKKFTCKPPENVTQPEQVYDSVARGLKTSNGDFDLLQTKMALGGYDWQPAR